MEGAGEVEGVTFLEAGRSAAALSYSQMSMWTASCERKVMDIHDWRMNTTHDRKMTSVPA